MPVGQSQTSSQQTVSEFTNLLYMPERGNNNCSDNIQNMVKSSLEVTSNLVRNSSQILNEQAPNDVHVSTETCRLSGKVENAATVRNCVESAVNIQNMPEILDISEESAVQINEYQETSRKTAVENSDVYPTSHVSRARERIHRRTHSASPYCRSRNRFSPVSINRTQARNDSVARDVGSQVNS